MWSLFFLASEMAVERKKELATDRGSGPESGPVWPVCPSVPLSVHICLWFNVKLARGGPSFTIVVLETTAALL